MLHLQVVEKAQPWALQAGFQAA